MAIYAIWNNKGGVGKSYLTFQIACEYAQTHPEQPVLVIDLCSQANASGMLLGGIIKGEQKLSRSQVSTLATRLRDILINESQSVCKPKSWRSLCVAGQEA